MNVLGPKATRVLNILLNEGAMAEERLAERADMPTLLLHAELALLGSNGLVAWNRPAGWVAPRAQAVPFAGAQAATGTSAAAPHTPPRGAAATLLRWLADGLLWVSNQLDRVSLKAQAEAVRRESPREGAVRW